ncbi:MAG TPA: hypothetical protein VNK73_11045 [Actinomycetota bacterium]|jgi:hypothetical protein|nr:hypothetical protein [Actinomycetota bacterium]
MSAPNPNTLSATPSCAPTQPAPARIAVLADAAVLEAAERAVRALRADGHELVVVAADGPAALDGAEAVLALGGPRVAELAREHAPAGAYVRSQALAGQQPDRDAVALTAARATALAVAPPRIGVCG